MKVCLTPSISRTTVSEDLVLKLSDIVNEKESRSRVWLNQVRDKGMSNIRCGIVTKRCKNSGPTEVVDTNKDIARALGAAWKLQEVKTNNVKGSCWI